MARPSKPEDQRAALVVGVRLTPAEKALVDQLTAPGPDGAPPRWTSASGLLRGLLHREAQRRGLEPPDAADVDGNPGDLDVVGSPARPAPVARLGDDELPGGRIGFLQRRPLRWPPLPRPRGSPVCTRRGSTSRGYPPPRLAPGMASSHGARGNVPRCRAPSPCPGGS
jgi:hypothetical protein